MAEFRITGDIIEYDNQPVAVFRKDAYPTLREAVEHALEGFNPEEGDEEISKIERELEDERDAYAVEMEEMEEKLQAAIEKRDAYASLLGVKPCD